MWQKDVRKRTEVRSRSVTLGGTVKRTGMRIANGREERKWEGHKGTRREMARLTRDGSCGHCNDASQPRAEVQAKHGSPHMGSSGQGLGNDVWQISECRCKSALVKRLHLNNLLTTIASASIDSFGHSVRVPSELATIAVVVLILPGDDSCHSARRFRKYCPHVFPHCFPIRQRGPMLDEAVPKHTHEAHLCLNMSRHVAFCYSSPFASHLSREYCIRVYMYTQMHMYM